MKRPSLSPYQLGINDGLDQARGILLAAAFKAGQSAASNAFHRAEIVALLEGIADDLALGKVEIVAPAQVAEVAA